MDITFEDVIVKFSLYTTKNQGKLEVHHADANFSFEQYDIQIQATAFHHKEAVDIANFSVEQVITAIKRSKLPPTEARGTGLSQATIKVTARPRTRTGK
jgi:hypothetical protein